MPPPLADTSPTEPALEHSGPRVSLLYFIGNPSYRSHFLRSSHWAGGLRPLSSTLRYDERGSARRPLLLSLRFAEVPLLSLTSARLWRRVFCGAALLRFGSRWWALCCAPIKRPINTSGELVSQCHEPRRPPALMICLISSRVASTPESPLLSQADTKVVRPTVAETRLSATPN